MEEQVVLVNEQDEVLGLMGKTEAHEKALLHRAISILIFNDKNEMLIQQRADGKYHWAGIWSNTVCTHPRENESYKAAAKRRLQEELGFSTKLKEVFNFIYKAKDEESGLTEHELDHVFVGTYNGEIPFNQTEVKAIRWISAPKLFIEIEENPDLFSFWFKIILKEFQERGLI
ncbi:MAG: isopentenyl-diphosphate Delta-isomerase [Chitinophagales bacterium]|nr:isopentenyl-diphosphate Delta-isomerase [Chitinophagales bacterium]